MEGITWALRLVLPTTDRGRGLEVSSSAPEDVTSASKAKDMGHHMQKSCATSFIKDIGFELRWIQRIPRLYTGVDDSVDRGGMDWKGLHAFFRIS